MADVTAVTTETTVVAVFLYTGIGSLLSPKTQTMRWNKLHFPLNCQIAVKMCCFCPVDVAPLVVGGFPGGHGKANLLLGAVPVLCVRCAETPPVNCCLQENPPILCFLSWQTSMMLFDPLHSQESCMANSYHELANCPYSQCYVTRPLALSFHGDSRQHSALGPAFWDRFQTIQN